jgi:predicted lipid carrier protein YhbT
MVDSVSKKRLLPFLVNQSVCRETPAKEVKKLRHFGSGGNIRQAFIFIGSRALAVLIFTKMKKHFEFVRKPAIDVHVTGETISLITTEK